jgi:hypothetical protein
VQTRSSGGTGGERLASFVAGSSRGGRAASSALESGAKPEIGSDWEVATGIRGLGEQSVEETFFG